MNKRGLSAIITTLLVVVLVLVAVGIVWGVVRNIITEGVEELELGKLTLSLEINDVQVVGSNVNVRVKRNPGAGKLSGIKFVISDGVNKKVIDETDGFILDELGSHVFTFASADLGSVAFVKEVSIAPIFETESGREIFGDEVDVEELPDVGTQVDPVLSCLDLKFLAGDGVYWIDPDDSGGEAAFQVYCDMTTDDGGWTLVVKALAGSQSHAVGGAVGALSSPTQASVAKLSNSLIITIGSTHDPPYETRFLYDNFPEKYYYQWNNSHAGDFNNDRPSSDPGSNIPQSRKNSYGSSWSNELVYYSDGCSGGYGPYGYDIQCGSLWLYGDSSGVSCHSGFGLSASCGMPWSGVENQWHRTGTMWVR